MQKFLGQNPEESFTFEQTLELLSQILELLSQIDAPINPVLNVNAGRTSATLPNPNTK